MTKISTQVVPFGEVFECDLIPDGLSKAHFVIPEIQREYQWGCATELDSDSKNRSATQFYNDLFTFYNVNRGNDDPYFLGTLIAFQEDSDKVRGSYQLMDGQQRWTTVTALMSIIRHYLDKDLNDGIDWTIEKTSIQDHFLLTSDNSPKLQSNREVDQFTIDALIDFDGNMELDSLDPSIEYDDTTKEKFKPNISGTMLYCVSQFFHHRIAEDFKIIDGYSSRKELVSFYNCIKDRIFVNLTIAPDATVAYKMFITANARGTSLNNFDIFKALTIQSARTNKWASSTIHKELENTNVNLNNYTNNIIGKSNNIDKNSLIDSIMADVTGVILGKRVSKSSVLMLMDNHLENISSAGKLLELVTFIERYTRVSWWLQDRDGCNIGRLMTNAAHPIDRIAYGVPNFKQHMPIYITAIVSWSPWFDDSKMNTLLASRDGIATEYGLSVLSHAIECYIVRCWLVGRNSDATKKFFYNSAPSIANEIKNLPYSKRSINKILNHFSQNEFNPENLDEVKNRAFKVPKKDQIGESFLTQLLYAIRPELIVPYKKGRGSQDIFYPVALMPKYRGSKWEVQRTWDYDLEKQGSSEDNYSQKIGNFFLLDSTKKEIEGFNLAANNFNDIETSKARKERINDFYDKVYKSKNVTVFKSYLKQKDWDIEDIQARTLVLIKQLERRFPKSGKADLNSYKEISARLR